MKPNEARQLSASDESFPTGGAYAILCRLRRRGIWVRVDSGSLIDGKFVGGVLEMGPRHLLTDADRELAKFYASEIRLILPIMFTDIELAAPHRQWDEDAHRYQAMPACNRCGSRHERETPCFGEWKADYAASCPVAMHRDRANVRASAAGGWVCNKCGRFIFASDGPQ